MNLFRSEEHVRRWHHYVNAGDDYLMPVGAWASVFSASMFRSRLDHDYLDHSSEYLEDYRRALKDIGGAVPAPDRILITVLFTDIVDSTKMAAQVGDEAWRSLLKHHNEIVRNQLEHFRGTEVDQIGDGFMASFDGPARAIRCATAICQAMPDIGIQVRTGVHSGECEVIGDNLGGIAVHIGARIGAIARPGEVLVSSTVRDAVTGSDIQFESRGAHELKGVPDQWRLFSAIQ